VACGLEDSTPEFPNLLKSHKLLELGVFSFSDFSRFPMFLPILESFSHTDSHTEYLP